MTFRSGYSGGGECRFVVQASLRDVSTWSVLPGVGNAGLFSTAPPALFEKASPFHEPSSSSTFNPQHFVEVAPQGSTISDLQPNANNLWPSC